MTTGDRIRVRRRELDMTVDELAETLGKNRATVYRYESNDIENMPAKVLGPLSEALKTTPAYLMGWTDDPYDYDRDVDSRLDCIPSAMMRAWLDAGLDNQEIWHRYQQMEEEGIKESYRLSPTSTTENIVKVAGRDGSFVERQLSDKQMQALKSFLDLLPDASDDL